MHSIMPPKLCTIIYLSVCIYPILTFDSLHLTLLVVSSCNHLARIYLPHRGSADVATARICRVGLPLQRSSSDIYQER